MEMSHVPWYMESNTEGIFSPTQVGHYGEKTSHTGSDGNWFMK